MASIELQFPWSGRSTAEWKKLVPPSDALRLLALAEKLGGIAKFELLLPLELFLQGKRELLSSALPKRSKLSADRPYEPSRNPLVEPVKQLFSNTRLCQYLLVSRWMMRNKKDCGPQEYQAYGWDKRDTSELQKKCHDLTAAFLPATEKYAHFKAIRTGQDLDEVQSLAYVTVSELVIYNYWELIDIDPGFTVDQFCALLKKTINTPADGYTSDAFMSELSIVLPATVIDECFQSPSNTESEALDHISQEEISRLIESFTDSTLQREILTMNIFHGLSPTEIAQELGISANQVDKTRKGFRRKINVLHDSYEIDSFASTQRPYWEDIFAKTKRYQQLYHRNSIKLTPFRRKLLAAFFTHQTGEKGTTLDAVCANFPQLKRGTIRRHIISGLQQLTHHETRRHRSDDWDNRHTTQLIQQAYDNQSVWALLPDKSQEVLHLRYLSKPGCIIPIREAGSLLGIDQSGVSRYTNKGLVELTKLLGKPNPLGLEECNLNIHRYG